MKCRTRSWDLDLDKMNRYARIIMSIDDRGIINILSRGTKSFCDFDSIENSSGSVRTRVRFTSFHFAAFNIIMLNILSNFVE